MPVLNTPPANVGPAIDDRMARLLVWLGELIQQNGEGKYVLIVHTDGSITVQRPRKPIEYKYAG